MDSFEGTTWDLIDYSGFIDEVASTDLFWANTAECAGAEIDASLNCAAPEEKECAEQDCSRKRGRNDPCNRLGSKACRERQRRERLNDKFAELSSTLEPGRPVKTDKLAILGDAIRILNQLKNESQEYKETNEKLLDEIKTLKAEKNELRDEKVVLKAEKEKVEQQMKAITMAPGGFMPTHTAAYQAATSNKMTVFPSYGMLPMWHYLPPSVRDTSQDHELRPPAA